MPKLNNWYVITGGPSTGKTSLIAELSKLGHAVIPEAARTVIDEAVAKGISPKQLRADEKRFQEDVAKLKQKVESAHPSQVLTFFDRGMHDTWAYMQHYGFNMDQWIHDLLQNSSYQKVFLLEPLPVFEDDYARTDGTADFRQSIQKLLKDAYTKHGMQVVDVPVMSLDERALFILDQAKVGAAA